MQPVLFISSEVGGLVYVNGRMAGVVERERPVSLPVAPSGAVYVQHFPFERGVLPMAGRMTFAAGAPVAQSLEGQEGMYALCWPGGAVELELIPERIGRAAGRDVLWEPVRIRWFGEPENRLEIDAASGETVEAAMPGGGLAPEVFVLEPWLLLMGATEIGGQYAIAVLPEDGAVGLSLEGREIGWTEDGALRAVMPLSDTVGHVRVEQWTPGATEFKLASSEIDWEQGAQHWPTSPLETALAAVEAAQLGLMDEAQGYLSPGAPPQTREALSAAAQWDGCTPMKYALADGRAAIGLTRAQSEQLVVVQPMIYSAVAGGRQGYWQLDYLHIPEGGA